MQASFKPKITERKNEKRLRFHRILYPATATAGIRPLFHVRPRPDLAARYEDGFTHISNTLVLTFQLILSNECKSSIFFAKTAMYINMLLTVITITECDNY